MFTDASGETLEGSKGEYMLVTKAPPVNSFWSITVYDSTTGRLHPNDDNRYHINNTTAVKNDDGTYTFRFKVKCEGRRPELPRGSAGRSTWPHVTTFRSREIMSGEWKMPHPAKVKND